MPRTDVGGRDDDAAGRWLNQLERIAKAGTRAPAAWPESNSPPPDDFPLRLVWVDGLGSNTRLHGSKAFVAWCRENGVGGVPALTPHSYLAPGLSYQSAHTFQRLGASADALANLLDDLGDFVILPSLAAYSLGGVVALLAIARLRETRPESRTAIMSVALIQPAIYGAPAVFDFLQTPQGKVTGDASLFQDQQSPVFRELRHENAPGPVLCRRELGRLAASTTDALVVYARDDAVAPYTRFDIPGLVEVPATVDGDGWERHGKVATCPDAMRSVYGAVQQHINWKTD